MYIALSSGDVGYLVIQFQELASGQEASGGRTSNVVAISQVGILIAY